MASALEQLGLNKSDFAAPAQSSALSQLGLSKDDFAAPQSDGITGPVSALKNIGQGFNRGLGKLASGADYALLGFLDDTKEGQAQRPLGYLAQVLKGEQEIPGTDQRFAHEPTTRGEELLQRGGEVLGESIGPAGAIAAPARMAARPASGAVEQALKTLSQGQASTASLAGETAGAIGSGIGQEIGEAATPGSAIGPVIGGLAGGLAPSALAAPGARYAAGKAKDAVANYVSPVASAKRAKNKVVEEIGPHIEDEATQARLQRAASLRKEIEGFEPDLAQATGSEALKESKRDIIRRASGKELEDIKAREAGTQEAIAGYAQRNAPEGQGGADEALEPLVQEREQAARQVRQLEEQRAAVPGQKDERLAALRSKATQRLDQLTERERQLRPARDIADAERQALEELTARTNGARADIAGQIRRVDRSAEGGKIRDSIKAERSRRMSEIDRMSKELGIDGLQLTTPFRGFVRSIDKWRKDLLPSQANNMPAVMQDIAALKDRPSITFKDIKALRESIVDEVLEATRDSSPGHRKRLGNAIRLRSLLDDQVLGMDTLEGGPGPTMATEKAAHYASGNDFDDLLRSAQMSKGGKKPFESLSDFLVKRGGLNEDSGELGVRDIGARSRPGLYRKSGGLRHDDAALAAWEAGFFPGKTSRPTPDDLLNALEGDINGRHVFREDDALSAASLRDMEGVADDLVESLDELDIDWKNSSSDEIRARIAESGQEPIELGEVAQNWKDFRRRYFEDIIEPFERGAVKKTTSKDGSGFYRTLDEEVALGFLKSADAAEQVGRIAKTQPELMASVEAVALDDLASSAVANGVINPRSLERWANSHRAALQHLPELRQKINEIVVAVGEVEGRLQRGKSSIKKRRQGEQNRLAQERQDISRQRQDVRRVAASEAERIRSEASGAQERLQANMQPLLERMGAHNERRMSLEDTQLSRRLAGIAKGSTTPTAVIDDALGKPAVMKRLWRATEKHPEARKALQRHIWDGLTQLDGPSLKRYLDAHEKSLNIAFRDSHLKKLRTIGEALDMAEFAPATGAGKPISTNLNEKIRGATGLNVSAAAATAAAVSRGRSSKTVEGLRVLFQVMTERGRQGYERLMREALFNPEVAASMVESAQFSSLKNPPTTLEGFANRRLRGWLWNLGITSSFSSGQEGDG